MKVTTMRGQEIDMDAIIQKCGDQIAVGTRGLLRMNARGDLVGQGGRIVKTSEDMSKDYNRTTKRAVRTASLKSIADEILPTPDEAVAAILAEQTAESAPPAPSRGKRRIVD